MKPLTEKQQATYNWIINFYKENGTPPTLREIGSQFSITIKAVSDRLTGLKKKGYITTSYRGIVLTKYKVKIIKKED